MKYIITESQYNFLMESSIPISVRRRANEETLKEYITMGEINYPTLCDDFEDGYEYADNVIDYAIDEFVANISDKMYEEDYYSDVMDYLRKLCRNLFSQYLIDIYETTCSEEKHLNEDKPKPAIHDFVKKYLNSKLNEMEFKYLPDEKDFYFNPKGNENPKYGIEGEWDKKGYFIIVGYSLLKEIMSLFNLNPEETKKLFSEVLFEKGIKPIKKVDSFDFSIMDELIG